MPKTSFLSRFPDLRRPFCSVHRALPLAMKVLEVVEDT